MSMNVITTVTLGTTTQVVVKQYGDGKVEFQETTAGGPVERTSEQSLDVFLDKLVTALATVA